MEVALRGPRGTTLLGYSIVTIGRAPQNHVVIGADARVSAHHAEIHPDSQGYVLLDRGSTNGTYINGQRIQPDKPVRLNVGDRIYIGGSSLSVEAIGAPSQGLVRQMPSAPLPTSAPMPQFQSQPTWPQMQGGQINQQPVIVNQINMQPQVIVQQKRKSHGCAWIIGILIVLAALGGVTSHSITSTPSSTTHSTQPSTHRDQPTVHPTATLAHFLVTHGTTHIGGPVSDFYGKYGKPNNQGAGNSVTWIVDQQPTLVNATSNASGEVTQVTVASNGNWSNTQMKQYCSQFLPPSASAFNSVSNLTDYHSSVGEIVMQLSQASCVLTISQS